MLRGKSEIVDFTLNQSPFPALEKSEFSSLQDTLHQAGTTIVNKQIGSRLDTNIVTTNKSATKYTQQQLDSIFAITEKREKQIIFSSTYKKLPTDSVKLVADTLSTKYSLYNFPFHEPKKIQPIVENFLIGIPGKTLIIEDYRVSTIKPFTSDTTKTITQASAKIAINNFLPGKERIQSNLDWFTITIIFSLFIFSWVKVAYQKFITLIIAGIVDYQVSLRLYREKNVLFQNVSIGLHLIFYINMGLFVFYFMENNNNSQFFNSPFKSVLTYSLLIFVIYNIKSITSKILGYIFLVKENFSQYIHNINLFNKNIGLFLFPIIIIYPFTIEKFKPFIIYAGLLLLSIMFLLRTYRSAQIIMREGISLFYLILYLCAVEILPVLLLIKFLTH